MSKHTPGPWSLPHFAKPEANCRCGYILSEANFGAVATVHCSGDSADVFAHGDNPKFDQAVANARLIAAAPDGLAAAEAAYAALIAHPYDAWRIANQSLYCALRDFIAKATGRSEKDVQDAYEQAAQ